jgi:shikimate kinase
MAMNTLLIGARGSGKSAIGRRLAKLGDLRFVDLDDRVLARFDEDTVQAIWATHGEGAWREAEVEALRDVLDSDDQIVALGGGTPMIDAAREMIEASRRADSVRVVYLKGSVELLTERLGRRCGDRPSLTGKDVVEEISDVLEQREPTYLALADLVYETSTKPPGRNAAEIAAALFVR